MKRVTHFDIAADDPARAKKFYEKTFDWKIDKWEGPMDYWTVNTGKGEGIDGGIAKRENKDEHVLDTIEVPSVDEYTTKVKDNGGKIVRDKTAIPGVGYMATFSDPEGNTFGLMETDEWAE